MFHSIRPRLILSYMALTLLVVAVVGSVTYQIAEHYVEQREIASLRASAEAIAKQAQPYLWPVVQSTELDHLVQTASFLGDFHVRIYDKGEHLVVDSGTPDSSHDIMFAIPFLAQESFPSEFKNMPAFLLKPEGGEFIQQLFLTPLDELPEGFSVTIVQRSGDPWTGGYVFKDWVPDGEFHMDMVEEGDLIIRSSTALEHVIGDVDYPLGHVEVSAPPNYGLEVLYQLRQALLWGGGGGVLLAGIVGFLISQWIASPLKKLAKTSIEMGAGDLSVRAEVKSKGEIGELANQFNHMAGRLESSFQQMAEERDALRRFITDASHELRTPITALKNFNALLLDTASEDPQARAEFLAESQAQIERLEWITGNLLDLSRLDSGLVELDLVEHDFREIIKGVLVPFDPLAEEKGVALSTDLPEAPCTFTCDRGRLEMALSNLLENALKFTPQGGEVEIGLTCQDGIQVWVRDTGVGIQPEDLPHIFERFYRGRGQAESGSGLGLAIVMSIVEAHGGEVGVESTPGEGTTVRITWAAD
jgi:signal transduction histidine kinase